MHCTYVCIMGGAMPKQYDLNGLLQIPTAEPIILKKRIRKFYSTYTYIHTHIQTRLRTAKCQRTNQNESSSSEINQ